ncbi:MAG: methyltransferase domain-containing protein, partial [Candidatus Heimdallarchaeota archaeon]|nr:methyltransferase domain-containing protein [Candidatus Heimdallarchaeota archaeon]
KKCLDAGCGLGYFSRAILEHKPLSVCACDLSPKLVQKLSCKLPDVDCVVANILEISTELQGKTFDVVVCSDVIEHTSNPELAVKQLTKIVDSGGLLSISVPNQKWRWLLSLAQALGLRDQYQGHENWVRPNELKDWIEAEGFEILSSEGVHTVPFKFFPHALLRKLDQKLRCSNYTYAFNLAIVAKKR